MAEKEFNHMRGPEQEKPNSKLAVAFSITFLILYVSLLFLSAYLDGAGILLLQDLNLTDLGVGLVAVLYMYVAGALFWGWGRLLLLSKLKKAPLIYSLLPIPVIGTLLWVIVAVNEPNMESTFRSIGWAFYRFFIFWAQPVLEIMEEYYSNQVMLKVIAGLFCWFPSCVAAIRILVPTTGIMGVKRSRWHNVPRGIPLVLAITLLITLWIPRNSPLAWGDYPRVDGATAAIPLGERLVYRMTGVNWPKAKGSVVFNRTHQAYLNLIEKKTDLIFAFGPSEEELGLAMDQGVELKLTPVGLDAFIFIVHRDNPVEGLSVEQIQQIYKGEITNWSELGGEDEPIMAYQREPNSGSQTFMEEQVMKGLKLMDPPMEQKVTGMGNLMDAISEYHNSKRSIGYSYYYYASEMNRKEQVKFLAINGVKPTKEHIRTGDYPYTATLYAVTRADEPASSSVHRVLEWLQTEKGRQTIEDGGYVNLN